MYRIIAITGRKGSGKNAAAKALGGKEYAFAEELKRTAWRWYGLTPAQTHGNMKEVVDVRWGLTPREIMQRLGTEVGRSIHTDTWTRFLLDRDIPATIGRVDLAVITDCRFPNECAAVQAAGGKVLRIVRPLLANGPYSDHPSETAIDTLPVDAEVVNDGSLYELGKKVLWATREWR